MVRSVIKKVCPRIQYRPDAAGNSNVNISQLGIFVTVGWGGKEVGVRRERNQNWGWKKIGCHQGVMGEHSRRAIYGGAGEGL